MTEENFDGDDVAVALARETEDGSGVDDINSLPPSDFISYAEDDVELDDAS